MDSSSKLYIFLQYTKSLKKRREIHIYMVKRDEEKKGKERLKKRRKKGGREI
jgi:hypothetical protein